MMREANQEEHDSDSANKIGAVSNSTDASETSCAPNMKDASNESAATVSSVDAAPKPRRFSKGLRILLVLTICSGLLYLADYLCKEIRAVSIYEQMGIALEETMLDITFALDESPLKASPDQGSMYESLSAKEKSVYEKLYKAVWMHKDSIRINDISADEAFGIFSQMKYDHPELIHVDISSEIYSATREALVSNTVVTFLPEYYWDDTQANEYRAEVAAKVESLIQELPEGSSDVSKARLLHNMLCRETAYEYFDDDLSFGAHSAYGALCRGLAVCEGYAFAYTLLCQAAGLECETIVGTLEDIDDPTLAHAWNRVKIDGEWLYVDVTNDDRAYVSDKYLLKPLSFMEARGYIPFEANVLPAIDVELEAA